VYRASGKVLGGVVTVSLFMNDMESARFANGHVGRGDLQAGRLRLLNATGRASERGVIDRDWGSWYVVAISDRRLDAFDSSLHAVYVGGRGFA
jgi:hypothetical protein